jgi:hypothetical protein
MIALEHHVVDPQSIYEARQKLLSEIIDRFGDRLNEIYQQNRTGAEFSITAEAFRYFITQNKLDGEIKNILKGLDTGNMRNLAERGYRVREAILSG